MFSIIIYNLSLEENEFCFDRTQFKIATFRLSIKGNLSHAGVIFISLFILHGAENICISYEAKQ